MNPTSIQPSIPGSSLLHDPSSETDLVAHAEKQVEAALDDLVTTGALQAKNQMYIESLLNPAGKSHILKETSDKEIYQAVIDLIAASENIEINGGDDVNKDIPIEPHTTRHDVLKAVSTINRYTDGLNDLTAHKFEAILGSFSRLLHLEETRNMKETILTDFFQRL
jgi:hypothetical protein